MITYQQALDIVVQQAELRTALCVEEELALLECVGRDCAKTACALDQNPRFDNAAMDGFALQARDSISAEQGEVQLALCGSLAAGQDFDPAKFRPHSCIEIMTGAKLPVCCDAVVKLEDVELLHNQRGQAEAIKLNSTVRVGENVRYTAQDLQVGEVLVKRGATIAPQHLLALVMGGLRSLRVFGKPRVCVFSTGNELVPFDAKALAETQIRNSASALLIAALRAYGAEVFSLGIVRDDCAALREAILAAHEKAPDIVISTGGVSAGRYDLVAPLLRELNLKLHFHKVAVRPGKPILFAEFSERGSVYFGLPGNPIAVAAGLRFFVRPYLKALHCQGREVPQRFVLAETCQKPAGLCFFQRAVRVEGGVKALSQQASFMAKSLLAAQGWIVGAAAPDLLEKGEAVDWYNLW